MPFPLSFANSGHGDSFANAFEIMQTSRTGINLNAHAIPSMSHLTASSSSEKHDDEQYMYYMMIAYRLDFFIHGQVSELALANGVRRGDILYLLQDIFSLTLLTVKMSLQQLLLKAFKDKVAEGTVKMEDENHKFYNAAEGDDDYIQKSDLIGRRWLGVLIGGYTR